MQLMNPTDNATCDLHVHSNCSDGSYPPEALIGLAREAGLSAVALTDHNTLAGLDRFEASARTSDVAAVPGVEVTAEYRGKEVHILGLFIPQAVRGVLAEYLTVIDRRKRESNLALIGRLSAAGYEIDEAAVLAIAGEATPNRMHIANVLLSRGYVASTEEAFKTLMKDGNGYYIPPERLDAFEVIPFLASLGIVPVLAHPLLTLSRGEVCAFLSEGRARGLIGVETVYTLYSAEESAFMAEVAERFGILPSGGSDFHGNNKPGVRMGAGRDNIRVPLGFYEALREKRESYHLF